MKRIMDKLKGRQILLGVIIGVLLMGGAGYAVDNLTSESVSYKRKDGSIMTVKQALDDLIGKADELNDKVTYYESMGVKYLADQVQVGDYVAYDAGTWSTTVGMPNKQGDFGGYTGGKSKNDMVTCGDMVVPKYRGWRVLEKDEKTKTVTIVHASQSECHFFLNNVNDSISKLNARANDYKNSKYATSARSINKSDTDKISGASNLRNTDNRYWLTDPYGDNDLYLMSLGGGYTYSHNSNSCGSGCAYGFRPVVVLKAKILTSGKVRDEFNQEAWNLIA